MSVSREDVVALVSGLLSDPGTSSKDHPRIVSKAVDLAKEIDFQVERANKVAAAPPKPAAVTPPPAVTSKK